MTIFEKLLRAYVDQEAWMHKITEKLEEIEIGMGKDILANLNQVIISDGNKWAKGSPFKVVETINPANGWHEYRIGVQLVDENGTLKDPDSALIITSNPNLYYKIKGTEDHPIRPFDYDSHSIYQPRWDGTGKYYLDGGAPFIAVHKNAGMTLSDNAWIDMKQYACITLTNNAWVNIYDHSSLGMDHEANIKIYNQSQIYVENSSSLIMHNSGLIVAEDGAHLTLHNYAHAHIGNEAEVHIFNAIVNITGGDIGSTDESLRPRLHLNGPVNIHYNNEAKTIMSGSANLIMDGDSVIRMNGTQGSSSDPEIMINGGGTFRINDNDNEKLSPTLYLESTGFLYNGAGYMHGVSREWGVSNVSGRPELWGKTDLKNMILSNLKESNTIDDINLAGSDIGMFLSDLYFTNKKVLAPTDSFWNDSTYLFDDIITSYLESYIGSYQNAYKKYYMPIDTIDDYYDLPSDIRSYYTRYLTSFPLMSEDAYDRMLDYYEDEQYHYSEYFKKVYVSTYGKNSSALATIFDSSPFKDTYKNYMYHKMFYDNTSWGTWKIIGDRQKELYGDPVYEKFDILFTSKQYSEISIPWYDLLLVKNEDGTYSNQLTSDASYFYSDIPDYPSIMIKWGTHILTDGYGDKGIVIQNNPGENLRVWLQGNSFIQHSRNSHEEMHDNSTFLMRGGATAQWKNGGEGYTGPMINPKGPTLAIYDKANVNIHGKWNTVLEELTAEEYVFPQNWKTTIMTSEYLPISELSSELRTSIIEYIVENYPSPVYEIDMNSILFMTSSINYYIQYIKFTYNEYPPEGWSPYVEKAKDSPLVEITENAVLRLHDNFVLSGNDEGVTISNGESSIDFSFEELEKLKNFINTL